MGFIKYAIGPALLTILLFIHPAGAQTAGMPAALRGKPVDTISLYLTFDDGIDSGSSTLLQLADSLHTPVTVFLIGKYVLRSDSTRKIWQRMQASPWLEAGNHSYSHANSSYHRYYTDPVLVLNDFIKNKDSLGLTNKLARMPGRNAWRTDKQNRTDLEDCKPAADTLATHGYKLAGWDLEWNYSGTDLSLESEEDLLFRIKQAVQYRRTFTPRHLVILCHDPALENPLSRARLISFIQKISASGNFRFSFLSNYPGLSQ